MAHKILDLRQALPDSIPADSALNATQVAAYRFSTDRKVYNVMDTESGLIDADDLEEVANELGGNFTHLQESLEKVA